MMKFSRYLPVAITFSLLFSSTVFAATSAKSPCSTDLQYALVHPTYGFQNPLKGVCLPELIANIVSQLLTLSGALFLAMFMYGGVTYLTAGGDKAKVTKAQTALRNAIIGIAIIVLARLLVDWILTTAGGIASTTQSSGK